MTGPDGKRYFAPDRDLVRRTIDDGNCLLELGQMIAFNKATYLIWQMRGTKG